MAERTGAVPDSEPGQAGNTLQPDLETIREHLEILFGDAGDLYDGLVEIAHGQRGPSSAHLFRTSDLDSAAAYAARVNAAREVVYVGAALRNPGCKIGSRTKKPDFYGATAAWCDLDDAKAVAASMETTKVLPPTHGVITGRIPTTRVQLWWRIGEPITDQQQLEVLLSGIRNTCAGDPSVVDSIRVMRLAGTVAWPTKKGRVAELTRLRSFTDDHGDLIALWNAYAANAERVQKPGREEGNGHAPEAASEYDGDPADLESLRLRLRDKATGRFDLELAKMLIRPTLYYPIMTLVTAHLIGKGVPDLVIFDMGLQWGRERLRADFDEAQARVNLKRQMDGARAKGWGPDWKEHLLRAPAKDGKAGRILPNIENAMTALRYAPEWKGVLWLCAFGQEMRLRSPTPYDDLKDWHPRGWTINDDAYVAGWLQRHIYLNVGHDIAGKAAASVAQLCQFHPVREYLDALKWDGTPRISNWLVDYFGADQENAIEMVFARRWLIAAVARIYRPGCKVDSILVLEGDQGIGKSTGLRVLCGDAWFTDQLPDLHNKDSMMQIQGRWIIEISELDAFQRAELSRIKAYISRVVDDFRPPYGRGNVKYPRQCVFAATTNHESFLGDETGNRRFWTVSCKGKTQFRKLLKQRDQLWAEAVAAFKNGELWWVNETELLPAIDAEERKHLQVVDSWHERLFNSLNGFGGVNLKAETTMHQCIYDYLGMSSGQANRVVELQVGKSLRKLGFYKTVKDGKKVWVRLPELP